MLKRVFLLCFFLLAYGWSCAYGKEEIEVVVQTGHTRSVNAVALSPNGKYLASGSQDKTIRLWDVETGRLVRIFGDRTGEVFTLAFSPDGECLASAGEYPFVIQIWEVETGKLLRVLEGHTSRVTSVAFSPNSGYLASGSEDDTIRLWNPKTGDLLLQVRTDGDSRSIAINRDGSRLASAGANRRIQIWELNAGELVQSLKRESPDGEGSAPFENLVALSPDGRYLASASGSFISDAVRLWELKTGRLIRPLEIDSREGPGGNTVRALAFSPDSALLASGYDSTKVRLWNPETGAPVRTLEGHEGGITSLTFSSDGRYLASGSYDRTARLWNPETGEPLRIFEGQAASVESIAVSPDGRFVASGHRDHTVRIWDRRTGKQKQVLEGHTEAVLDVAFSPDSNRVATGSSDGTIRIWNLESGGQERLLHGSGDRRRRHYVTSVAFSPDGKFLVSGGSDATVRLWNLQSGREVKEFQNDSEKVFCVAFSPDGKCVASGGYDNQVRLWYLETGRQVKWKVGLNLQAWVFSLAFSPDGRYLAAGNWGDCTITLYDLTSGKRARILVGHADAVRDLAFSPDGIYLLSAGDQTARLWEVSSGRELRILQGHKDFVTSAAFSPDGKRILSGGFEGSIKEWETKTGELIATMTSFRNKEWVVHVPENYFDSSPEGDRYVAFRMGNKIHSLEQFAGIYKRPAIVAATLAGEDVAALIAGVESQTGVQVSKLSLESIPPPEVTVRYLKSGQILFEPTSQTLPYREITISAKAADRAYGLNRIVVENNGQAVLDQPAQGQKEYSLEGRVILNQEENKIVVYAISNSTVRSNMEVFRILHREEFPKGMTLGEIGRMLFGKTRNWAVLIGIDEYDPEKGYPPLPYAVNDASAMRDLLIDYFGYSTEHIIFLPNATKEQIETTLGVQMPERLKADDRLIVFFSGHGDTQKTMRDPIGYLIPKDAEKKKLYTTAISMRQLEDFAELIPAKQIIFIIDSCYSGIAGLMHKKGDRPEETRKQVVAFYRSTGRQIMTAGTSEESTFMSKKWDGHSVYTYHLIEGLKGRADQNGDGVVTSHELQVFLEASVPKEADQTPQLHYLGPGEGQFVFYRDGGL